MTKPIVKIVVGANYGDEGKGLATHYFTQRASGSVVNVLYNGGPQRGHTVEYKNGLSHIYHHFGSGFLDGAPTYFDADFMVNPILFRQEHEELTTVKWRQWNVINFPRYTYIHPDCRVMTPWDAFVNQIVEEYRGNDKHNSCGLGIWETKKRYESSIPGVSHDYGFLSKLSDENLRYYLTLVREYSKSKLEHYDNYDTVGPKETLHIGIPSKWEDIFWSDNLMTKYIEDFNYMKKHCIETDSYHFIGLGMFDNIIFEAGQGLALDEDNKEALPHVTASKTGSVIPIDRVRQLSKDIEICYVTRTYFTRHGAGLFPTECHKDIIDKRLKNYTDRTNQPNDFQGNLRYGFFELGEFMKRVERDYNNALLANYSNHYDDNTFKVKTSIMITHKNLANGPDLNAIRGKFDYIYTSDSPYAEDIKAEERMYSYV